MNPYTQPHVFDFAAGYPSYANDNRVNSLAHLSEYDFPAFCDCLIADILMMGEETAKDYLAELQNFIFIAQNDFYRIYVESESPQNQI